MKEKMKEKIDYYVLGDNIYLKKRIYKYYKKNNSYKSYEINRVDEYNKYQEERYRLNKILYKEEIRLRKEYELENSQGYCEKCFCLKSLNGKCPICGE